MFESLKNNGFNVAAVTQIVGIIITLVIVIAFFTTLRADVGYLKDEVNKKATSEVVDAQILRISELVGSNSNLMTTHIDNINANIALIQQDIRQLQIYMRDLSKSR